jgi:hypothetical protein
MYKEFKYTCSAESQLSRALAMGLPERKKEAALN